MDYAPRPSHDFMVRLLDLIGSMGALILLAPVFATTVALIFVIDGGPILFRQRRVGRRGKPFYILKFRTMRSGSAPPQNLTVAGDLRVTHTGKPLRKLKLDELPQLINVLRGEMSLIGPRPEVPEYVEYHDPLWQSVLEVKPGITDASTLVFRDEEEVLGRTPDPEAYYRSTLLPAKLRMTLEYQRSRTLLGDLKLLWWTAQYSLFPRTFDRERMLRAFEIENI